MGISTRFCWHHAIELEPIQLFTYSMRLSEFASSPNLFSFKNLKWMNQNLEKVFHLSIIIDNPIRIIYSMEFEPELYFLFLLRFIICI